MNEQRAHDPAHDIVEHLQSAALELIAAARAFLDVAEELVKDPSEVSAMASSLVDLAGRPARPDDPPPAPGVEHIRVS